MDETDIRFSPAFDHFDTELRFATFFNPGALSDGKVEVPEAGGSTNPF